MIPEYVTVEILESGVKLEEESNSLPEIIYSAEFIYTLKFTAKTKESDTGGSSGGTSEDSGGSGGITPSPEIIVSPSDIQIESPFPSVVIEKISNDTVRLSGSYLLAFDDYYKFVRKSGEQVILPPNTNEKEIALIQYKMPSQTTRTFSYNFLVAWPIGSSYEGAPIGTSVVIEQESFWTTAATSANISKLKNKGF